MDNFSSEEDIEGYVLVINQIEILIDSLNSEVAGISGVVDLYSLSFDVDLSLIHFEGSH